MKNSIIKIGENLTDISNELTKKFLEIYKEKKKKMKVAFSGGKTPKLFFENLAELNIDWSNIDIFLVDERNVPLSSIDSNFNLLTNSLLAKINIPKENIHPIEFFSDVNKSNEYFHNDLINCFNLKKNEYPVFDFILLGLGNDGHTASLFPENFDETSTQMTLAVSDIDRIAHNRISLGLSVINNADSVAFLVTGKAKSEICKEVFISENKKYPSTHVEPKGKLLLYLDKEAASML